MKSLKFHLSILAVFALLSSSGGLRAQAPEPGGVTRSAVETPSVGATARAVDNYYNHLKSLKAEFTEVYQGQGMSRSESGTLWLKKPGRMRWDYHVPREKLFLIDADHAYFYITGEQQARKTPLRNLDDIRSPLRYLLGKTKLEKELEALSLAPDLTPLQPGDVMLRGVPKGMKDEISSVVLEISPAHEIRRIVIHGVDGAVTDFRFSQLQANVPVQDSQFRFTPPPGVTMVEDSQVAQ